MTKAAIIPKFVEALHKNILHYETEKSVNRTIRSPTNEEEKGQV